MARRGSSRRQKGDLPRYLEAAAGCCSGNRHIHHPFSDSKVFLNPAVDFFVLGDRVLFETGSRVPEDGNRQPWYSATSAVAPAKDGNISLSKRWEIGFKHTLTQLCASCLREGRKLHQGQPTSRCLPDMDDTYSRQHQMHNEQAFRPFPINQTSVN